MSNEFENDYYRPSQGPQTPPGQDVQQTSQTPQTPQEPQEPQQPQQPDQTQNGSVWRQDASGYYHFSGDPQNTYSGRNGYGQGNAPQNGTGNQTGYGAGYNGPNDGSQSDYRDRNPYGQNYGAANQGYGAYGNSNVPPRNPMMDYSVNPTSPEKKKKHTGKIIAAVLIACLLVGGTASGVSYYYHFNETNETNEPTETENSEVLEETPASTTENSAINTTVIDVTTNSTETTMTPQDVYEHYVNAVVAISNESTTTNYFGQISQTASSGSGMILTKDGYILTNNHVVSGAETLTVLTTDGEEYDATVIGADSENDVALIKIEGTDFPTVSVGDSDSIQVGEQVCAIGNPLGELTNTLTVGYVSALNREITESTGSSINMFQTDCAINSGNSGGPIFDMNGNVMGITTAKPSSSSSAATVEGIGFCIPINDAMDIVDDLLQYGYVKGRVSMGISCQDMNSFMQYYNLPIGPYILMVGEGSAAEKAGLQKGDMILEIDGESTESITDMKVKLKKYQPGDTATIKIYRTESSETMELQITFDEMQSTTSTEEETESEQQQQQQQQQLNPNSQINPFG